jgi:hypothetical protein
MPLACLPTHVVRWLDRDDLVASIREPGRVAAGSGADVQNAPRRCRLQIQNGTMRLLERNAFVRLCELGGVGVVRGDGGRGLFQPDQGGEVDTS